MQNCNWRRITPHGPGCGLQADWRQHRATRRAPRPRTFRAHGRQPGRGRGRRGRPVQGLQGAVRGRREGEPIDKRLGRGSDGIEVLLSRQLSAVAAVAVVGGAAVREVDAPAAAHGVVRGEEDLAVPAAAACQAVTTPHGHQGLHTCATSGNKTHFLVMVL